VAISVDEAKVACVQKAPVRITVSNGAGEVSYLGFIQLVPDTKSEPLAVVWGREEGTKEPESSLGWVSLASISLCR
jgi:hypothetical protein